MPTETLAPNAIISSSNVSGGVIDIDEPVDLAPTYDSYALNFADVGGQISKTVTLSGIAGDLWLGFVSMHQSAVTISDPADWSTPILDLIHEGAVNFKVKWWWRYLTGSLSDPSFSLSASTDEWGCGVVVIKGANASAPIDAIGSTNTTNTASPVCPDITTLGANRLVLRVYHSRAVLAAEDSNYPTNEGIVGVFARTIIGAENVQNAGLAYQPSMPQGAVGTATWPNVTTSANVVDAATIAIKA